jgi:hypothetical protein
LSPPPPTIVESAQVLGHFCYVEGQLQRRLGVLARPTGAGPKGPAARTLPAAAMVWLAGASMAHSWRAEQIRVLLPVSVGLPGAEELTCSPGAQVEKALEAATAPSLDVDSLFAGLVDVIYGSLIDSYRQRLASASPACDPPVVRVLDRLVADVESVRRSGATLTRAGRDRPISADEDTDETPRGSGPSLDRLRDLVTRAGGILGTLH